MSRPRGGAPPKTPPTAEAGYAQLNDEDALSAVWDLWSQGAAVRCATDGAGIALTVDATIATYRFVCTACGNASPWFEVSSAGLRTRPSSLMKTQRPEPDR